VTLADDDGIDLVEDETNAAADLVAAWLSLLRRSMNDAAMITAGMKRIDAIAPPCKSATMLEAGGRCNNDCCVQNSNVRI